MGAAERQVQFILQRRSQAEAAAELGIPRSTLGYVARGERSLPSEYKQDVRNYYQRESYGRAREAGFSATQARRFSWYAPETVATKVVEFTAKVFEFTEGVAGSRLEKALDEGAELTQTLIDNIYKESYEDIKQGLRDSPEPIEEILDTERY